MEPTRVRCRFFNGPLSVLLISAVTVCAQTNASSLVHAGPDGELVYTAFANQGQSNAVNTIPDFSRAGYRGGGVPIPFVPAVVTVTNGPGDDTALIQNAIAVASASPMGTNGFRGAVLLKAGTYEVSTTLLINTSGVVLRGEGSQANGGTKIIFTATNLDNLIEVAGGGSPSEVGGTRRTITDSYVPVGATSFAVSSTTGYGVGDRIRVQRKTNTQWITDLGMDAYGWTAAAYQLYYQRVVTAVTGDTISIDAPIVQVIEDQYGGGDIFKYTMSGRIENVGVESLRLESVYAGEDDENHGWIAVRLERVANAWVRQVTARYFGYSCVSIHTYGHQITVEDCAQLDPKSPTTGGYKYSFNIDDSDFLLLQRCFTRAGRHDYVSGSQTPGPNAFVDCLATGTLADIGPHHRYATGQIYDNVKGGQLNVQNRRVSGTGHGWSGAQILFWNCDGSSMVCDAPLGGMNWSVGFSGTHVQGSWPPAEPDGIWDSQGTRVAPRSLYYAQLRERLGKQALRNVILPPQESGDLWTELNAWAGEGLFLDDVIVWQDQPVVLPTHAVTLRGVVRNLRLLDNAATNHWTQLSGPGSVGFGDASALETTATFSQAGDYTLQLSVDDGPIAAVAAVAVSVSPEVTFQSVTSAGGTVTLRFASLAGLEYSVWYTTDLASPAWNPVQTDIPGDGTVLTVHDPAAEPMRFYQLRAVFASE